MVYSRITSTIDYPEGQKVHSEDIGFESSLYEVNLCGKKVCITLGKVKYTYVDHGVLYFPLYLVSNYEKIFAQIGLYEIDKNRFIKVIGDESHDVDVNVLGTPLLFESFKKLDGELDIDINNNITKDDTDINNDITNDDIDINNDITNDDIDINGDITKDDIDINENITNDDIDDDINEDGISNDKELSISENHFSKISKKIDFTLKDDIFIKHERQRVSLLPDEIKDTAESITRSYRRISGDNWIKVMMKNPNYELINVPNDNFLDVIKDTFEQIGYYTTTKKLSALIAKKMTDKHLAEKRILHAEYIFQIDELRKKMLQLKRTIEVDMKSKIRNTVLTKPEQKKIIDECLLLKKKFEDYSKLRKEVLFIVDNKFGEDFKKVTHLESYKEFITSTKYRIDEYGISIIEKELDIKMIILEEDDKDDPNEVIKRGECNENYCPKYYILCTVSNGRYKCVSYKNRKILEFSEIPYHLKTMIVKKIMSGIAGPFSLIEHFKNFCMFIGIKEEKIVAEREEINMEELYDSSLVLMFYSKSSNKKVGECSGDSVNMSNVSDFLELSCTNDWRRMLDDSWLSDDSIFIVDNKRYASVIHYYHASKYMKGFSDFAYQFSLDSGSKISKDLIACKCAISKSSEYEKIRLRPKGVVIDPDFYKGRNIVEREKAITAKFEQNHLLRWILINTKNAKLNHYIGNKLPEVAISLMKVRKNLQVQVTL